jgi:hypothetical protein
LSPRAELAEGVVMRNIIIAVVVVLIVAGASYAWFAEKWW